MTFSYPSRKCKRGVQRPLNRKKRPVLESSMENNVCSGSPECWSRQRPGESDHKLRRVEYGVSVVLVGAVLDWDSGPWLPEILQGLHW